MVRALCTALLLLATAAPLAAQQAARLRIAEHREGRELVLTYGPTDVSEHAAHGVNTGAGNMPALAVAMPMDGWLRGYTAEIIDAQGRRLPQAMLHHLNLISPQKRELFSQIMLRLGAMGSETDPVMLPRFMGYRVRRGDSLLVAAMVHSPDGRSYRGVSMRIRLFYQPARPLHPVFSIYPFYLDVMPPAGVHAYDLPAGRSEQYWQGRPAVAGRILAMGGHLHRYAIELKLTDVTTGRVLWRARPRFNAAGDVESMPNGFFLLRRGLPIRPDHVYRLTAVYENPTGRAIPEGAMGALGGVFLPDRRAQWPRVNRVHPEYQRDVLVTYNRGDDGLPPAGGHDHGGHEH